MKAPGNLDTGKDNIRKERAFQSLRQNPDIQRLVGYQSSKQLSAKSRMASMLIYQEAAFQLWNPRLHERYRTLRDNLLHHHPGLDWTWPDCPFAAATFNLGPQTVTYKHRDLKNAAGGWCAITSAGTYDPKKGGHLVLWDLGLVVEFPPGSTILIPSALVYHSNVPVQEGEERFSFTQYTAGGLFRWVEYGYQKMKDWYPNATREELEEKKVKDQGRFKEWLGLFSTLDDLRRTWRGSSAPKPE